MKKRIITFLLLGLVLVGIAEWDNHKKIIAPVRKLDNFWVEFCLGIAGKRVSTPSLTMVRITDEYEPVSMEVNGAKPDGEGKKALTRLDYATFLYAIGKLKPKSVAFMPTPVFSDNSVLNQTSLYPLKDAALQLPRLVLATEVSGEELALPAGRPQGEPVKGLEYPAIQVKGSPDKLPAISKTVTGADPELSANGDPFFLVNNKLSVLVDAPTSKLAEVHPRVQLVARQGDKVVPGFVLGAVAGQAGVKAQDITLDLEAPRPFIQVGEFYKIPVARDGSMIIPSHNGLSHAMFMTSGGKRNYHFASLKVEDVALAAERSDTVAKTIYQEFEGKFESLATNLVLLGYDLNSERNISNGNGELLSPMTATARAIATIQSGRHTTKWHLQTRAIAYGVIFIFGLVLLALRKDNLPLIFGAGVVAVIALVLIFRQTLSWTPPAAIVGLFLVMFMAGMIRRQAKKQEIIEPEVETKADQ